MVVAGACPLGPVGLDPQAQAKQPAAAHSLPGVRQPVEPFHDRCVCLVESTLPGPQLGDEFGVHADVFGVAPKGAVLGRLQVRLRRLELAAGDLQHRHDRWWAGFTACLGQALRRQRVGVVPAAELEQRLGRVDQQKAFPVGGHLEPLQQLPTGERYIDRFLEAAGLHQGLAKQQMRTLHLVRVGVLLGPPGGLLQGRDAGLEGPVGGLGPADYDQRTHQLAVGAKPAGDRQGFLRRRACLRAAAGNKVDLGEPGQHPGALDGGRVRRDEADRVAGRLVLGI